MKLHALAYALELRLIGDGSVEIVDIASLESAGPAELAFVDDSERLADAQAGLAGALIVGEFAKDEHGPKPLLIAPQPRIAFARAARLLLSPAPRLPFIHPTAVVAHTAEVAPSSSIGAYVTIGEHVRIGERVFIESGCHIADRVEIGDDCHLYPGVCIYSGTRLGHRVVAHAGAVLGSDGFGYVRETETGHYLQFPQVGRLEIHDDVDIGANTTIDRGALDATVIERGVKIDNLVQIGHNVRIGEDVVIAAQTGIAGSSVIERGAVIGGQVGIADHVTIGEGVILGAQAGVPSKKILHGRGELFWGTPARAIKQVLREMAVLGRMVKK